MASKQTHVKTFAEVVSGEKRSQSWSQFQTIDEEDAMIIAIGNSIVEQKTNVENGGVPAEVVKVVCIDPGNGLSGLRRKRGQSTANRIPAKEIAASSKVKIPAKEIAASSKVKLQSHGRNAKSPVLKNWPLQFTDQVSFMQQMNITHPPVYDMVDTVVKCYQCPPNLVPDKIPGAFRPPTIPSGLWSKEYTIYKRDKDVDFFFAVEKDEERREKSIGKIAVGGEHKSVAIDSKDLVVEERPFDSGSTCKIYKGSYSNKGIPTEVACKEFQARMTPKFRRRLEKEGKCILQLNHPNVLRHFGVDFERSIIVSEYLVKEVNISADNCEYVHNARQLIDSLEEELSWSVRLDIMQQASYGLAYLHEKGIIHCDIKAGNIFLGGGNGCRFFAKIGDFGQAAFDFGQFSLTQTTSFPGSQTQKENERNRVGTIPYTAPELFDIGVKRNLKSDVYSFAMVMVEFSLPERSHPWEGEISTCDLIHIHVKEGRRPSIDLEKLKDFPKGKQEEWFRLIQDCWSQTMDSRPSMNTVSELLSTISSSDQQFSSTENVRESSTDDLALVRIEDVALDVHQGTVAETAGDVAVCVYESNEDTGNLQQELEDCINKLDGTNACPFLAVKNAEMLYSEPHLVSNKEALKREVESILRDLPSQINDLRDATQYYDVEEAMTVLNSKGLLRQKYYLKELVTDQLAKNYAHKTTLLKNAVLNMTKHNPSLAVYTCSPICNTVGFLNDTFVIIDTHCISSDLGGSGNGFVKLVHCEATSESREAGANVVVNWLERRMTHILGEIRGEESLLHLVITEDIALEPGVITLSDDELLETFASAEHTSECENLRPTVAGQEVSDKTSPQEKESCSKSQETQRSSMPSDSPLWQHPSPDDEMDEKTELLWKGYLTKFGLSSLKQFQLDAIRAIEKKKDVIIVQKTGSGKSLCYQLPSLFEKNKTTVVICPTISLINSQVESLRCHSINAVAAGPHFGMDVRLLYQDELPSIIYTTPEFYENKLKFSLTTEKLKLVVIDEVHKVFDRNDSFRSSYNSLTRIQEEFPTVPIMALTATLDEDQLHALCSLYLRNPVLIRDSVNRPNIKLNICKYKPKRSSKGNANLVWMDTAKEITRIVGEEYAIVYMDFRRDVELMVNCLKEVGIGDVRAYHGKLPQEEKKRIDTDFRKKQFQILVATESYEVGTHSPHVHNVFRIGCMRNAGVIIQEFGRAGRGGEQSDGYLIFNEHKDDQRLNYWTQNCNSNEAAKVKKTYQELWRWIYGIYNGTCLRISLLKWYENASVMERCPEGECCSSCDIRKTLDFEGKETAALLLGSINELDTVFTRTDGINEDKLISWLLGAKRDWISDPEIQAAIDKSTTFAKGSTYNGKILNQPWWQRHLKQLISLGYVDIVFNIIRTATFSNTYRTYKVSETGKLFLENPQSLKVLAPFIDPLEANQKSAAIRKEQNSGGRGIHHLPKIRNAMTASTNWYAVTEREQYEFPGYQTQKQDIGFCKAIKDMPGFGSHQRIHFMWDDNQLTKRHTNNKVCQMVIDGENTEVTLRRAPCEGVKVCQHDGCNYTVTNRQKINKCQEHGDTHKLKSSGPCPAQLIYIWPTNDDGRRWIGIVPGITHNHMKPAAHVISQETKQRIKTALTSDSTLTTKDLQKGYGVGMVPGELSPAASNPERLRKERSRVLKTTVVNRKSIFPLLQIMDFENIRKKVESQQDESESTLSQQVNEMIGKYQMEGMEYLIKPERKHAFFMSPYQAKLLSEAEELFTDITYTGNEDFPYMLNMVVFNPTTIHYQAVARVLCDKQDGESYATSFQEVFDKVTRGYPNFKKGHSLKQILVDFDDAEYNGLVKVVGKDFAEKVIRGCSVHWMRSVNRVAKIVCTSNDEESVFKYLGKIVQEIQEKDTVIKIFDVMSGKKDITSASEYLPDKIAEKCRNKDISNGSWKKLKHWANWWTSTRHLQMFTKAYAIQEADSWDESSNTTNPVESINRQSFKSKNNLHVILENMYMEDRLHAVKMLARSKNVNIDYTSASRQKSRKRKRSSLIGDKSDESGPPDKLRHVRDTKEGRKKGRALIDCDVKVEYQERESGKTQYLGWLLGTITSYNNRQGYLVTFKNQKDALGRDTGNWTDWIPTVNSPDVELVT